MPAARGVKRAASKSSTSAAATGPKNKKKRGVIQLEVPTAPKKRGHVLACGQGDVGQLGLGEDVVETTKFKLVTGLGDKIVDVYAGGMHTIALDSSGKVWTFGCNDEGALGRATSGEADEGAPAGVALPAAAVAVAAGDSHSAALLHNGDVYAWGAFRDSHGSMGLVMSGREGKSCRDPVKLDIGEQAVGIASGGDHLVILSASGGVFTLGCGEQGQLGRLAQRSASRDARQGFSALLVPGKVSLKGGAARVWAGYHATFVLDAHSDKMLAWGLNNYGQLGISGEKRKGAVFSPTECDAFGAGGGWRRVACGQHHSLALDADGRVYAVGRCEYGRLGLGERSGDAEALEQIPKLQNKKCVSIAAGTSNSFAVTDSGEVFAWGMGSEGQLGTGSAADASEPTAAALPELPARPLHVSAGGQHTVLLVEGSGGDSSPAPRQQHEEISSTSAPPADDKPQKVNGDENKETPMEVDETDKPQETDKKDDTDKDTEPDAKPSPPQEAADRPEPEAEATPIQSPGESKPETTDTSSQGTEDSDAKSQPDEQRSEMDTDPEVNGTPDSEPVEAKPVEAVIQSANPLTTSA